MVRTLLIRGMLAGIVAGLLAFGFSKLFGEPPIERAIAFESQMDEAKSHDSMDMSKGMDMPKETEAEPEPELVSRGIQASIGLFTGVMIYCAAFGGLFALVFAFAYGRAADLRPRSLSALLAAAGFVAVYLVPTLKYPANPPSVGLPDTVGYRTALFCVMITASLAAMVFAGVLRRNLVARYGEWSAALIAAAAYLGSVVVIELVLPSINEVPEQFPAVVLWQFRIAALGTQFIMWTTIGLLFGALAEGVLRGGRRSVFQAA
jgi:predicted cobalt transporter CbtA